MPEAAWGRCWFCWTSWRRRVCGVQRDEAPLFSMCAMFLASLFGAYCMVHVSDGDVRKRWHGMQVLRSKE